MIPLLNKLKILKEIFVEMAELDEATVDVPLTAQLELLHVAELNTANCAEESGFDLESIKTPLSQVTLSCCEGSSQVFPQSEMGLVNFSGALLLGIGALVIGFWQVQVGSLISLHCENANLLSPVHTPLLQTLI